jgi:TRAP-type C4-dicarboxylate transport system permease small subunit
MRVAEQLARAVDGIADLLCNLFAIALGLIILAVGADILLRNLGLTSFPWTIEVTEYVLYAGTFLAAPRVLRNAGHVRVEILLDAVPRRWARILDMVADLLGFGISAVLLWYGAVTALDAYRSGMIQFKNLIVPEWILLTPIPVGCALLCIEFLLRLGGLRRRLGPETAPALKPSI